ncbi:non-specific serine/threonine protein kinase OS=Streptomyces alboniger OX=132473 GN=CP975_18645 PE=3 SV=1 [Streptomyces alboniger]
MPEKYLGTWEGVLKNDEGSHLRTLVIAQGDVGDEVVALTAVGPMNDGKEYRCTFLAELKSVSAGTVRLNSSTVTSGEPSSACEAGGPTTLTLVGEDRLRRANADGGGALTYTRSR